MIFNLAISVGVHQGSDLSPLLFITVLDTIAKGLIVPAPFTLIYADDIVLNDTCRMALERRTQAWKDRLCRYGLRLNVSKTEYLESGVQSPGTICVDNIEIKKVLIARYLGSLISANGSLLPDVSSRISAGWLKWRELTSILCDKRLPIKLKSLVYKMCIRPVILYAAECRASLKRADDLLHVTEMKMIRRALGISLLQHITNPEIRKRMQICPINEKIIEARLIWFGRILCKKPDSVVHIALLMRVPGTRPRGRPKKRWIDNVLDDMEAVGLTEADATNITRWKRLARHADPSS